VTWLPSPAPPYWGNTEQIQIVDVGANPIDGTPEYTPLMNAGIGFLNGFEPDYAAFCKLPGHTNARYSNCALGATKEERLLHLCRASGMNSFFRLNGDLMQHFPLFRVWGEVLEEVPVKMFPLWHCKEIESVDYLKIDVQGYEAQVFAGAAGALDDTLVVQTETMFIPIYAGQPLFGDQAKILQQHGLMFHTFLSPHIRPVKPLGKDSNPFAGVNQWVQADAVFVRDLRLWDELSVPQLLKMAAIMDLCYRSYDLAYKALSMANSDLAAGYLKELQDRAGVQAT
jgi:protein O-GlcNAc transferase